MKSSSDLPVEFRLHLKDYLGILWTHRWVFLGVIALCLGATYVALLLSPKRYTSSARLLLQRRPAKHSDEPGDVTEVYSGVSEQLFVNTFVEIAKAEPLLSETYEKFGFAERGVSYARFKSRVRISRVRHTQLLDVSFEDEDPKLAADALNYLVKAQIRSTRQRQAGLNEMAIKNLREKENYLRGRLALKQQELDRLMKENELDTPGESESIVIDRLRAINQSLNQIQLRRIEADGVCEDLIQVLGTKYPEVRRWRKAGDWHRPDLAKIAAGGKGEIAIQAIPEYSQNRVISELKMEYFKRKQELDEMALTMGPANPHLAAQKRKLEAVRRQLEIEVLGILAAAIAERRRLELEEKKLLKELQQQQDRVLEHNRLTARYRELLEEKQTYAERLLSTQRRLQDLQLNTQLGSRYDNVFVVEPPQVPDSPSFPRRRRALALALAFGILFGGALCFLLQYMDTTVKDESDVGECLELPVLGRVPAITVRGNGCPNGIAMKALRQPRSRAAEAFRAIRTALSFAAVDEQLRHLQVTSGLPGEGKTLVSINLAATLAQAGKQVLLVDADMRRPRLHRLLDGIANDYGFANALIGEPLPALPLGYSEVSGVPRLRVLPCGPIPPNPAELLAGSRLEDLLATWDEYFDIVLFDTPPVNVVTDAAVLGGRIDGTVLVLRSFSTQRNAAIHTRDLMQQAKARVLGVVLNGADAPKSHYGYGRYAYGGYGAYGAYGGYSAYGYSDGYEDEEYYADDPEEEPHTRENHPR